MAHSAPSTRASVLWEGVGAKAWERVKCDTSFQPQGEKKSLSSRRREVAIKTWSWDEKLQHTQPSPAAEPDP